MAHQMAQAICIASPEDTAIRSAPASGAADVCGCIKLLKEVCTGCCCLTLPASPVALNAKVPAKILLSLISRKFSRTVSPARRRHPNGE